MKVRITQKDFPFTLRRMRENRFNHIGESTFIVPEDEKIKILYLLRCGYLEEIRWKR